jgi:predicted nucleic acid-binding protein
VIVVDTSFIYALLDARDACHPDAVEWYLGEDHELVTTPLVLAETDHLAGTRAGDAAVRAFRRDVAASAYAVEWWSSAAAEAVSIADRYADSGVGLTDASLVALAGRVGSTTVATFDERHFRALRPLAGAPAFTLVPADARAADREAPPGRG